MRRRFLPLAPAAVFLCAVSLAGQEIPGFGDDPDYKPRVERPTFAKHGPKVLVHRQKGSRRSHEPFMKLLKADGYRDRKSVV